MPTQLPLWTFNRRSAELRFEQHRYEADLALPEIVYQSISDATSILQHIWAYDLGRAGGIPENVLRNVAQAIAAVNLKINDRLFQGRSLEEEHIGVEGLGSVLANEALLTLAVLYGVHGGWSNPIIFNEKETSVTVLKLYTDRPLDEEHLDRYLPDQGPIAGIRQMLLQIPGFFALRRHYHPNLECLPYAP